MAISMDAVNALIWRYMEESGFCHSAFLFHSEALIDDTLLNSEFPGALVSILQHSLLYMQAEKSIASIRSNPTHPSHSGLLNLESLCEPHPLDLPLSPRNCCVLQGHSRDVLSCRWSPDGRRLATSGADGAITIWSVKSGIETDRIVIRDLTAESRSAIVSLDWNRLGTLLASASLDGVVRLYVPSGQLFTRLAGHHHHVFAVRFSPSGQWLASAGADSRVIVWAVDTGRVVHVYAGNAAAVLDLDWKDDAEFATGSADFSVRICRIDGSQTVLAGHSGSVVAVAWNFERRMLASASEDQTVRIWRDRGETIVLAGHDSGVNCVKWIPECGNWVVSAANNGSVRIWDADRGDCLRAFERHTGEVVGLAVSPAGSWIASGGVDQTIDIADVASGERVAVFRAKGRVLEMQWDPTGDYLAVSFDDTTAVVIWVTHPFEKSGLSDDTEKVEVIEST
jgi:transducin (beta)-like 1